MIMDQPRRFLPRQRVQWSGRYRFGPGDPDKPARLCQVVDISARGSGIELFGTTAEEADNQLVTVTIELRGEVRSAVTGEDGVVRVGIEFPELVGGPAEFVRGLRDLGTRW
jgi:hypothetical protein